MFALFNYLINIFQIKPAIRISHHLKMINRFIPLALSFFMGVPCAFANQDKNIPEIASRPTIQDTLKDGSPGPIMILIRSGKFIMGDTQQIGQSYEKPTHEVTVSRAFSIGKYPVTFREYDKFTTATDIPLVSDYHWGRDERPVINVNLSDARAYAIWLSKQTGHTYRLPSEAEWEYSARAGTSSVYPWGNEIGSNHANCASCGSSWDKKMTSPVGQFSSNAWGIHDMIGNVWELTADCWNYSYKDAPTDGSPWKKGDCLRGVIRGGSWGDTPQDLRSATRLRNYSATRTVIISFRLVREN